MYAELNCTVLCHLYRHTRMWLGCVTIAIALYTIYFCLFHLYTNITNQNSNNFQYIYICLRTYISASFLVWKVRFHFQPNKRWCECLSVMVFRGREECKKKEPVRVNKVSYNARATYTYTQHKHASTETQNEKWKIEMKSTRINEKNSTAK